MAMETKPRMPEVPTTWTAALLEELALGAEVEPVLVALPELEVEEPPKSVVVIVG